MNRPQRQEADDVRVAELLKDLGLAAKPLVGLALFRYLATDDLHRGRLARLVGRAIDHAHGAGAEDRLDSERTELFANHGITPVHPKKRTASTLSAATAPERYGRNLSPCLIEPLPPRPVRGPGA